MPLSYKLIAHSSRAHGRRLTLRTAIANGHSEQYEAAEQILNKFAGGLRSYR